MLSHICLGTSDFRTALDFYTLLMARLGLPQHFTEPERQWAAWRKPGLRRPLFIIGRPFDGNPASAGNGQMTALSASSHQMVDECHALALRLGGTDEGAPGVRTEYHPHFYGAYFRDQDGNKICVCCHDPAGAYQIRQDDLTGEASRGLVALHLAGAHENSPPGSVFALDISGLLQPDVTLWTAWDGENIAGMAALKMLGGGVGELKSMRAHPQYLRKGLGRRMLSHVMSEAVARGLTRISLETGSGTAFEPALALYRAQGFVQGAAFAGYEPSAFSQFFHLDL